MANLSERQRVWLFHYLPPGGRCNATEAARQAGYAWPNKSGPRVSHSPKIRPIIRQWFIDRYGRYLSG
jgi:phage terminase small subunit